MWMAAGDQLTSRNPEGEHEEAARKGNAQLVPTTDGGLNRMIYSLL